VHQNNYVLTNILTLAVTICELTIGDCATFLKRTLTLFTSTS